MTQIYLVFFVLNAVLEEVIVYRNKQYGWSLALGELGDTSNRDHDVTAKTSQSRNYQSTRKA